MIDPSIERINRVFALAFPKTKNQHANGKKQYRYCVSNAK